MSETDFRTEDARAEADLAAERDEQVTAADAGPVDDEGLRAAEGLTTPPGTAEHYREMTERGAHQQGEGKLP